MKKSLITFAILLSTGLGSMQVARTATQTMLKPVTIACPPAVNADTHPARNLPGWIQNIANGWLDSAMYDNARHVVKCTYGIHPNPPRVLFTTLERGIDRALVNCRVTADQKAVMCESSVSMQSPSRIKMLRQ